MRTVGVAILALVCAIGTVVAQFGYNPYQTGYGAGGGGIGGCKYIFPCPLLPLALQSLSAY